MIKKLKQRIQSDSDFLFSLFIQGTNTLIPLIIYLIYNTRVSSHDAGKIYYYKALFVPLATLVDFGLNIYSCRELTRTQDIHLKSKIVTETLFLKLIIFLILISLNSIYSLVLQQNILLFFSAFFLIEKLFDLLWYYQGNQEFDKLFFHVFTSKIVLLIIVYLFIDNQNYFILPILEGLAYGIVGSFFGYFILKKQKAVAFNLVDIIKRARNAWQLCLSNFMNILSGKSFLLLTGLIISPSQFLIFDVADKVLSIAKSIVSAYEIMIAPRIYSSFDRNSLLKTMKNFILLAIILIFIFQSFNFINSDILSLENIFTNSNQVIRILLWSLFPFTITMLFGSVFLLAIEKDGKVIINQLIQIVLTIISFGSYLILRKQPNEVEFSFLYLVNQILMTVVIISINLKTFKNYFLKQ